MQATTTVRGIPQEVPLSPADGLPKDCVANMDNIQTISKALLTNLVTHLSDAKMAQIRRAIIYALGL